MKTIPIKDTSITFKINGNPYSGNYGNIGSGILSSGIKNWLDIVLPKKEWIQRKLLY